MSSVLQDVVRVAVCLLFLGVSFASLAVTPKLEVGLEQDLSMPEDSFVLKYFRVRRTLSGAGREEWGVLVGCVWREGGWSWGE